MNLPVKFCQVTRHSLNITTLVQLFGACLLHAFFFFKPILQINQFSYNLFHASHIFRPLHGCIKHKMSHEHFNAVGSNYRNFTKSKEFGMKNITLAKGEEYDMGGDF